MSSRDQNDSDTEKPEGTQCPPHDSTTPVFQSPPAGASVLVGEEEVNLTRRHHSLSSLIGLHQIRSICVWTGFGSFPRDQNRKQSYRHKQGLVGNSEEMMRRDSGADVKQAEDVWTDRAELSRPDEVQASTDEWLSAHTHPRSVRPRKPSASFTRGSGTMNWFNWFTPTPTDLHPSQSEPC